MKTQGKRVSRLHDKSTPSRSPAVTGSSNVLVDGRPVLRDADVGTSGWRAIEGAPCVLVNDRRVHRIGDKHSQCESAQCSHYTVAGNQRTGGADQAPPDGTGLDIFCEHKIQGKQRGDILKGSTFEVAEPKAEEGKHVDVVTILYKDSVVPPPDTIEVQRTVDQKKESLQLKKDGNDRKGYSRYLLTTEYEAPQTLVGLLARNYSEYELKGLRRKILVRHRDPRLWQVELLVPELRSLNVGHKVEGPVYGSPEYRKEETKAITTAADSGWKPWDQTAPVTGISVSVGEYKIKKSGEDFEVKFGENEIKLKNGALSVSADDKTLSWNPEQALDAVKAAINLLNSLTSFLGIVEGIYSIVQFIKENVPKVGWYADLSVQFLQGSMRLAWQWREHTDHRDFLWLGLFMKMTLVKIGLEIGVGVSALKVQAQAFLIFEGQIDIEQNLQRDSPDHGAALRRGFSYQIKGGLGARLSIGKAVQVELKGTTGLKFDVNLVLGGEDVFAIEMKVTWTGVEATISAQADLWLVGGSYEKQWQLPGKKLVDDRWPAAKEYNPPTTTRATVESIMTNRLTDWCDTHVYEPSGSYFSADTYHPADEVARRVTDVVVARSDVRRDHAAMEGLGHWVGSELAELEELRILRAKYAVEKSKFDGFLVKLNEKLTSSYVDPCKEAMDKMQNWTK